MYSLKDEEGNFLQHQLTVGLLMITITKILTKLKGISWKS